MRDFSIAIVAAAAISLLGCKGKDDASAKNEPAKPTTPESKPDTPAAKTPDTPAAKTPDTPVAKVPDEAPEPPPPAVKPAPGSVRVAIVHEGELLKSEARAVAKLEKVLGKHKGIALDLGAASDEEKTAWQAYAGLAAPPEAVPAPWRSFETVVVLQVLAPREKRGKRYARGVGDVLILRPPSAQPVYRETGDGEYGASLSGEGLGQMIRGFLGFAAKGQDQ